MSQHRQLPRGSSSRAAVPSRARILAAVAAAPLMAAVAVVAPADAAGFVESTHKEGLFYGNFDEGLLLFVGATPEQFCSGDEPTVPSRVFVRGGTVTEKVGPVALPIYLYESELGAPELIDEVCGGADVEPLAQGVGNVKMRIVVHPVDDEVHIVNRTIGTATSPEATYKVKGTADLMVVGGEVQGDPSEFQGLRVSRTGA